jgi:uncharacterized membrane protein
LKNRTDKDTKWAKTALQSSDCVIAILITIMVLELKVPRSPGFRALLPLWPMFMSYVLSFVYIGIYWSKHQYARNPSGASQSRLVIRP